MIIYNTATNGKVNVFTNSIQRMTIDAAGNTSIGSSNYLTNTYSFAQGSSNSASADYAIATGNGSKATQYLAIAQQYGSRAEGYWSIAQGYFTKAYGTAAYVRGNQTIANGDASSAIGNYSVSSGEASFASGYYVSTVDLAQHVFGIRNIPISGAGAFIIGNGQPSYGGTPSNLLFAQGTTVQITGSLIVSQSLNTFNRTLQDGNEVTSIDWSSRALLTPTYTTSINWSENDYLDSNVYQRDFKSRPTQNSVSNNLNNAYSSYLGDLIEVDGSDVIFDGAVADGMLVYLDTDATWYPVTQNSTTATKMLGIACNVTAGAGFVLLEGHVVITDTGTSGPHVTGADHGLPIYIEDNTTTGQMSTTVPTTTGGAHVIRVLGHCYWNNAGTSTQWMMKFRPSNNWILV
jgi:hypothetical protein